MTRPAVYARRGDKGRTIQTKEYFLDEDVSRNVTGDSSEQNVAAAGEAEQENVSVEVEGTVTVDESECVEKVVETKADPEEESAEDPSAVNNNNKKISSLDELYTHCEQLVETLSQASEELRQMQTEDYMKAFQVGPLTHFSFLSLKSHLSGVLGRTDL